MTSCHNVFLFFLSRASAYSTVSGTLTPNFIRPSFLICAFILFILRSRFLGIFLVHHLKVGSFWRLLAWTYSASSIGFDCLTNDIGTQSEDPYFRRILISQPFVVIIGFLLPQIVAKAPL